MKPTVISNSNASTGASNHQGGGNGITIPINHEFSGQAATKQQRPQYQAQHHVTNEPQANVYGSPGTQGISQQHQPAHIQDFDFEPDIGIDMFPRTRLGRMTHDHFGDFGGTTRKRTSLHDPQFHTDGFSRYFDDDADFGFPQFNSLGRRRINPRNDNDFFNRLPSEFRQYIPENFAHRRSGSGMAGSPATGSTLIHPQQSSQQQPQTQFYNTMNQPSSRNVCDAAIQTEDPTGHCEVDHKLNTENLNQHGLRNTMDMGVKSPSENDKQNPRSSSAPPAEQQQQQKQQQPYHTQVQQIPINSPRRHTPPPQQQDQFATQTSPQIQTGVYSSQLPHFQKQYYAPQQQTNSQQRQQTPPPPQTPSGSYIRTIPIFVEGRSEPIINNKEIPNQNEPPNVASANSRAFTPPKQHAHRPTPLNTQNQEASQQQQNCGLPPHTPHTVDTINKIQDIQRDVLDLMSRVEKFAGTRANKEYVYLDEMLTRNLLKLDNIDTNGKESIRLARKEAIKCIQASINVLEAKAEENKKATLVNNEEVEEHTPAQVASPALENKTRKSTSADKVTKEPKGTNVPEHVIEEAENKKVIEAIPLPPPGSQKFNEVKIEDCPEDDASPSSDHEESTPRAE